MERYHVPIRNQLRGEGLLLVGQQRVVPSLEHFLSIVCHEGSCLHVEVA